MQAHHLTIVHYPQRQHWYSVEVRLPDWEAVSAAVQRMDDDEYPIVQLSYKDVESCFSDDSSFNIVGGAIAGFAMFEMIAGWQYEDPRGGDEDVRLWKRDQGYFCQRKNILADLDGVLRIAKVYFDTGSYEAVQTECVKMRND